MTFKDEFLDAWERRTMLPDCPLKAFDEKYDVRQRIIDAARRREAEETKRRAMSDRSTGPLDAAEWAIAFDPNYVPPPRMSDEERAERIARIAERWLRKRALVEATARNLEVSPW